MNDELTTAEKLSKAAGYLVKRARRWANCRYRHFYFRNNPDHPSLSSEKALSRAKDAESVLFLCWGNVCRSPLAERYLRSRLAERELEDVTVASAGLGNTANRQSPETAVRAAQQYDVDLSTHRSMEVSRRLVDRSDVVFVMDLNNFHSFVGQYPESADDVFFLRTLASDSTDEIAIPDPHRGGLEQFLVTYDTITDAIDTLAASMAVDSRATDTHE